MNETDCAHYLRTHKHTINNKYNKCKERFALILRFSSIVLAHAIMLTRNNNKL